MSNRTQFTVRAHIKSDGERAHIKVLYRFFEDETPLVEVERELPQQKDDGNIYFKFTVEEHPDTEKEEEYVAVLHKTDWSGYKLYIFPQYGVGSIIDKAINVETLSQDEYEQYQDI